MAKRPNADLNSAKRAKKDEFYTQMADIDAEVGLDHYKAHFADKVVYCNCDDPEVSNFSKYFEEQWDYLKLKGLRTTCYRNRDSGVFSEGEDAHGLLLKYSNGRKRKDGSWVRQRPQRRVLDGDGGFESAECRKLLEGSDIVVTNPPFSRFREYVAQLIEWGGKFLIIGNVNALSYKEIFPLFQIGKMWMGPSIFSGDREFGVPDHYPLTAASSRIDAEGKKYVRVKGVRWFTNMDHPKRHEPLDLAGVRYSPERYRRYDNYPAIEVKLVADIPADYDGEMGVPITFLDKYCPKQFEIVGLDRPLMKARTGRVSRFRLSGEEKFARIVIRRTVQG